MCFYKCGFGQKPGFQPAAIRERNPGNDPLVPDRKISDGQRDGVQFIFRTGTLEGQDASAFGLLSRRGGNVGPGAILSLSAERVPLNREVENLPLGWL